MEGSPALGSIRVTDTLKMKIEILRNCASLYQKTYFVGEILNSK